MAKNSKRRSSSGLTIPIAVVGGLIPPTMSIASKFPVGGLPLMGIEASRILTGYDPNTGEWNWRWLKVGLLPIALGALVHRFVGGKLGVNRALASAGIPLIRL